MTGEQMRAARELLGWSQLRLASRAHIPENAVAVFENTGRMQTPMHNAPDRLSAVRAVLEAAGVEFHPDHVNDGGVLLRVSSP